MAKKAKHGKAWQSILVSITFATKSSFWFHFASSYAIRNSDSMQILSQVA